MLPPRVKGATDLDIGYAVGRVVLRDPHVPAHSNKAKLRNYEFGFVAKARRTNAFDSDLNTLWCNSNEVIGVVVKMEDPLYWRVNDDGSLVTADTLFHFAAIRSIDGSDVTDVMLCSGIHAISVDS